jgi:hypothetical protein
VVCDDGRWMEWLRIRDQCLFGISGVELLCFATTVLCLVNCSTWFNSVKDSIFNLRQLTVFFILPDEMRNSKLRCAVQLLAHTLFLVPMDMLGIFATEIMYRAGIINYFSMFFVFIVQLHIII